MNRKIKIIIWISAFLLGAYLFKTWFHYLGKAMNQNLREGDTILYHVPIPQNLKAADYEFTVKLDSTKKVHQLLFPGWSTQTDVIIYYSTYLDNFQTETDIQDLLNTSSLKGKKLIIDITKLQKGKYFVNYLSFDNGGVFPLYIK